MISILPKTTDRIGFFFFLSCIVLYAYCLIIAPFGADSGYYLSCARMMADGLVPYRDFSMAYTPVSILLLSIPYQLFGTDISSHASYGMLFLTQLANTGLLYVILRKLSVEKNIIFFCLGLYLLLNLKNDGLYLGLEPFAIFFGLLALITLTSEMKGKLWICGLLLGVSFLTKQYALAFAPVVGGLWLFTNHHESVATRLTGVLKLAGGFLIPILFIYSYYAHKTGDQSFYLSMAGNEYGNRKISMIFLGLQKALLPFILVIPMLCLSWKQISAKNRIWLMVSGVGIAFFALQYYFQIFPHYHMFLFPFCILILAITLSGKKQKKAVSILFYLLLIGNVIYFFSTKGIPSRRIKKQQIAFMQQAENIIDKEKKCLVFNSHYVISPHLYSEMGLKPIDLKNNRFGFETNEEMLKIIRQADYVMIQEYHLNLLKSQSPELYTEINRDSLLLNHQGFLIFRKQK